MTGKFMDGQMIALAEKLVGKENVQPAFSLINFPNEISPAIGWIFGQIFVCKDMESAKKVAFHDKIMRKCVTLEGDLFDPAGTLSGGAQSKSGSILLKLEELKETQNELKNKEDSLREVETALANVAKTAEQYESLKQKYDLLTYEIDMVKTAQVHIASNDQANEEIVLFSATINCKCESENQIKYFFGATKHLAQQQCFSV